MTTSLAVPNLDPKALEAGKRALELDLAEARTLVIEDRETYAAIGAVLIQRLREYDVAKDFRDKVTKPVHAHWKYLCELLSVQPHEELIRALKAAIGAYDLREREAKEKAATEARAVFAAPVAPGAAPDVAALTTALAIANAPDAQAEGVATRFVWKVKRLVFDLLPDQYWAPDMTAIEDEARRQGVGGDDPPVIPGVVFERVAQVSGRRK